MKLKKDKTTEVVNIDLRSRNIKKKKIYIYIYI